MRMRADQVPNWGHALERGPFEVGIGGDVGYEQTAPRMARLLCAELMRQTNPNAGRGRVAAETVVGV